MSHGRHTHMLLLFCIENLYNLTLDHVRFVRWSEFLHSSDVCDKTNGLRIVLISVNYECFNRG